VTRAGTRPAAARSAAGTPAYRRAEIAPVPAATREGRLGERDRPQGDGVQEGEAVPVEHGRSVRAVCG
jgi:hypothetical protein